MGVFKYLIAMILLQVSFCWAVSEVMGAKNEKEANDKGPICCYYYTANEANAECRPFFKI